MQKIVDCLVTAINPQQCGGILAYFVYQVFDINQHKLLLCRALNDWRSMKIYHNNRCSTSRATLALIEESGEKPEIIEYLKTPPTEAELKEILEKLGMKASEIVRKKEELYTEKYKGKKISNARWVKILVKNPILIERPIVVRGNKAVLGRPPENVNELL